MLEDPAPATHRRERGDEAAAVVALDAPDPRRRSAEPVAPPPLAGRVRDHGPGAGVQAGVAGLVPRVHAVEPPVDAAPRDVERRDHASTACTTGQSTGRQQKTATPATRPSS